MSKYFGMLKVEDHHQSPVGKKAIELFEKLRRKAVESDKARFNEVRFDPRLGEDDDEPNFQQLNRDAVKSLHFLPEVQKTDEGHEVV